MTEKNMKFSGKNAKFSEEKQLKCFLIRFRIAKTTIITEKKTLPIYRVSVFSLIHHLETQILWVLRFKGIKVDPATL